MKSILEHFEDKEKNENQFKLHLWDTITFLVYNITIFLQRGCEGMAVYIMNINKSCFLDPHIYILTCHFM